MNRNTFISFLSFFLILGSILYSLNPKGANAASLIGEEMLVLYDAASGAIPGAPLLSFIDFPTGTALPTYAGGVTVMDTTTAGSDTYAGWIANGETTPGFPILDRTAGLEYDPGARVQGRALGFAQGSALHYAHAAVAAAVASVAQSAYIIVAASSRTPCRCSSAAQAIVDAFDFEVPTIIVTEGSFHGRTMATLTARADIITRILYAVI